jgi:triosephosphate isomerase (TIM)
MRKSVVAGNWKMNKTVKEARSLIEELLPELQKISTVEKIVCPPFTALMSLSALLAGTSVGLGAQDLYWEASGAYTGAISPSMIKEFCEYVIIGHSERRALFGETDSSVNKKSKAALANGLIPIVCVGETLSENESGKTAEVVSRQVNEGLAGISQDDASKLIIAYEPVWAIGTGRAASGDGANKVLKDIIRPALSGLFSEIMAESIRILYGGSVTSANAAEFFSQSEIDGALVGGASLKPFDFIQIVKAAQKP